MTIIAISWEKMTKKIKSKTKTVTLISPSVAYHEMKDKGVSTKGDF